MTISKQRRGAGLLAFSLVLVGCLEARSFASGHIAPLPPPLFNFDGIKIDDAGQLFTGVGSTVSLRLESGGSYVYGPSFGSSQSRFQTQLPPGTYELGVQVPLGFNAEESLAEDYVPGMPEHFLPLGPLNGRTILFQVSGNHHVHLALRFTKQPNAVFAPVNESLVCNVAGVPDAAQPTDELALTGTSVGIKLGIDAPLGGIGVKLDLVNPSVPEAPLQVIEARSAGGAAWQTSITIGDEEANAVVNYNQAAGNSAEMWGFGESTP